MKTFANRPPTLRHLLRFAVQSCGLFAGLILSSASMHAQATPPASATAAASKEEALQLNAFVVTGSVAPRKQMESPVAITTIDRSKIEDLAPRNFAEIVKAVPGIYVESTGGEAFNNVSIRGIGTTN